MRTLEWKAALLVGGVAAASLALGCSSGGGTPTTNQTPGGSSSGGASSGGASSSGSGSSGGASSGSSGGSANPAGCMGGQTALTTYPAGPYGVAVGDTVGDFCLTGYKTYSQETLVPMAMHDFYDPKGTSPNKLLYLSAGMTWCSPCNLQASEIAKVSVPGVALFQVMLDGPSAGIGAQEVDLKAWDDMYKLPFWVAMDPMRVTANDWPDPHPPGAIIDTKTMKVLYWLSAHTTTAALDTLLQNCLKGASNCHP